METLGLAPGEPAPPPILQPPPLFPVLDRKPLELQEDAATMYLVDIKQELKQSMRQSAFHLSRADTSTFKIEKYSDKHRRNGEANGTSVWQMGFPGELRPVGQRGKKPPRVSKSARKRMASGETRDVEDEGHSGTKKPRRRVTFDEQEEGGLGKRLEGLERAEQLSAESEQSAEEENVEEEYEEEEEEEGTDYNLTYFDNGEDYDVGEDDNLEEGPIY